MKKIVLIAALTLLVAAAFNSCKKKSDDTPPSSNNNTGATTNSPETQSAYDNTICESEFTAIVPATTSKAITTKGISGRKVALTSGPYIWFTDTANFIDAITGQGKWPRRMIIDYDRDATGNLLLFPFIDVDGRIRKGRISMLIDTFWVKAKSPKIKIDSLVNYSVDGITYKADSIVISKNDTSQTTSVYNGKCSTSTWNLSWSGTRTFAYVSSTGGSTPDEVHVTGSAYGVNKDNVAYSTVISSPIVKNDACKYISSGTINLSISGRPTFSVDYSANALGVSSGSCDNAIAITVSGVRVVVIVNY
ncbi:MAG: hypothetical protein IT235_03850 [Bacteroidia bacterium]|nr:hypothetical protein [Bacteroidia bacterium]